MIGFFSLSLVHVEFGFALHMPSISWRVRTSMPTRRGQSAVVTGDDGLIYVMGGFAGTDPPNATVEAYSPLTDSWTTKASIPQATRGAAVAKAPDGTIYLIGGGNGTTYLTMTQAYYPASNTWSPKTLIPAAAWMGGAATGDDGKIYVVGGESSDGLYSNKTQIYDPSTDSWMNGKEMPTGRSMLGVVKGPDGLIYAIGGVRAYNESALSVVEVYDPSNNTWTERAPMQSPRLGFGIALGPDGKIYVIGGGTSYFSHDGPVLDTVEVYDPETDKWTTPSWSESVLRTARKELGAALGSNGRIYAIGGTNGTYLDTNEEAFIVPPENIPPIAHIDSITPSPAIRGETIRFVGHGTDADGSVVAYQWRSSLNGIISIEAQFNTSTLSEGTHTIYFSVKDNSDTWSEEIAAIASVDTSSSENPFSQELRDLNYTVKVLSEEVANLTAAVELLAQENKTLTLGLIGIIVCLVVLVIVGIVGTRMGKLQRFFISPRKSSHQARNNG